MEDNLGNKKHPINTPLNKPPQNDSQDTWNKLPEKNVFLIKFTNNLKSIKFTKFIIFSICLIIILLVITLFTNFKIHEEAQDKINEKPQAYDYPSSHSVSLRVDNNIIYSWNLSWDDIPNLVFWKGYLFRSRIQEDDPDAEIVKNNLQTGEKTTALNTSDIGEANYITVSSIDIVDDKLVFILSGYMEQSRVYWLQSPNSESKEIVGLTSAIDIEILNSHFYITGGFADGCGGASSYYLLDPTTMSTKFIITSHFGCADGEEILGTYNDEFIVSNHERKSEQPAGYQFYQNIKAVSMTNSEESRVILDVNEMPTEITTIFLNEVENMILMKGEELYLFDLNTHELKSFQIPNFLKSSRIISYKYNNVCLQHHQQNEKGMLIPKFYKGDLNDGSFFENSSECNKDLPDETYTTEERIEDLQDYFRKLDLPSSVSVYIDETKLPRL